MAKRTKDYFGLGRVLSLVLVIFPVTAWILGVVVRIKENKIIAGIIRIPLGLVAWIPDIIMMIYKGKILRLLNM